MSHPISIEQLLESGAHFGHLTRRWNPKMAKYIFTEKNGIHIFDLRKTQILINIANNAIHRIATSGRNILFVGTKTQIKSIVEKYAKECNQNYVSERWLGGMLTNFSTIRKSIKRLNAIDKMEVDGTFEKITKKERLLLSREKERLRKVFGGIEDMTRLPGALFVVDIKKEHIAIKEAKILNIPVIAIVDTNTDPEQVDIPIPANDDSAKTVELLLGLFAKTIIEGNVIAREHAAERKSDSDRFSKENDETEEAPVVKRKLRERRSKKDNPKPAKSQRTELSSDIEQKVTDNSDDSDSKIQDNEQSDNTTQK